MTATENLNGCMAFIVVKAPVPGQVKSRLAASIGDEAASGHYMAFVKDEVSALRKDGLPLTILYLPPGSERAVLGMVGSGLIMKPQRGADLGERLLNGFLDLFENGYDRVIALSSDVPELTSEIVLKAFGSLMEHDAVIGPCTDGGYYLLGFRTLAFRPEALTSVPMGTDTTASITLSLLSGLKVHVLPTLSDIDTMEDLRGFIERTTRSNGGNDDR